MATIGESWSSTPSGSGNTNIVGANVLNYEGSGRVRKCGIPFILFAGDGSANGLIFSGAGSGAFTLSAAVTANFIPTSFYAYLPADQAYAGSASGWYFGKMTTTTAGTLYANTYDPSTGDIATTPSLERLETLPVTKLTRLTQSTSEITFLQESIAPIGVNGIITETIKYGGTATSGLKTFFCRIGSTSVYSFVWGSTLLVGEAAFSIQNAGTELEQVITRGSTFIGNTGATAFGANEFKAIDLSAPFLFKNSMQIAANTESLAIWPKSVNIN